MIVDPPSFQKGSFVLTQDYRRILRRLPELLVPGGTLLACINDPAIGPDFLLEETAREAPSLHFVERLENPPEFPMSTRGGPQGAAVPQRRLIDARAACR